LAARKTRGRLFQYPIRTAEKARSPNEFSSTSQEGHVCWSIEVTTLKHMSESRCSNRTGTQQVPPLGATYKLIDAN